MKYLFQLLNEKKDYLIVFILFFFLSSPYVIDVCSGYLKYNYFDKQEFLLWNHTAIGNVFPNVDIFYPYGLLNYFKNYNLLFVFINYLIPVFLFTMVYFLFKKIFKEKLMLYFSATIFYLFTLILSGLQTFSRYGTLVVFSLVFSYFFYCTKRFTNYFLICCGIILSFFVFILNDQGLYLIISFIFAFLLRKYVNYKNKRFSTAIYLKEIVNGLIFTFLGLSIGLIPIMVFYNGNFNIFLNYFRDVGEIAVVSKTPFFSFIDSPANIFTIPILIFAMFFNFLKVFFIKYKLTLSSFFQISLILSILIMEQKSIFRSIDKQITFVSLILLMFIAYELLNVVMKKRKNMAVIYVVLVTAVSVIYGFSIERPQNNFLYLFKNLSLVIKNKCFDNNLDFFLTQNSSYAEIINLLKKQSDFNGKVFSFSTGDSAFYILLNQKIPYYNAIFEGSSYEKQNSTIKYIHDNKIEYVILNTNKLSLQDAVPDYIRENYLFKYILNNYQPFEAIGDHMILRKMQNNDFFTSKILKKVKDYENYLLNVYLYKIPYSEGFYKYNYLKYNNKLIVKDNIDDISIFLRKNKLVSRNKAIVLIPDKSNKSNSLSFIKLETENEHSTTIYYNSCHRNEVCVINLSRIPLFYEDRLITKLNFDDQYNGKIEILSIKNPENLW